MVSEEEAPPQNEVNKGQDLRLFKIGSGLEGYLEVAPRENYYFAFGNLWEGEALEEFLKGLGGLVAFFRSLEGLRGEGEKISNLLLFGEKKVKWEGFQVFGLVEAVEWFKNGISRFPLWLKEANEQLGGLLERIVVHKEWEIQEVERLLEFAARIEKDLYYLTPGGREKLRERFISAMKDFPLQNIEIREIDILNARSILTFQSFPEIFAAHITGYFF